MGLSVGAWELAIVLGKLLSYAGLASLAGIYLVWWLVGFSSASQEAGGHRPFLALQARRRLFTGFLLAALLGSLAVIVFFLLQTGLVNQNGIRGMFDAAMMGILLQSPIGYGAVLKLSGFLCAAVALLWSRGRLLQPEPRDGLPPLLHLGMLLALVCFAASFAVLGHVANLDLPAQIAIGLHVTVMGLWVGALYPLHSLCRSESAAMLLPLMRAFGAFGWAIIAVLVLAGAYLLTGLLTAIDELFVTTYGLLLLGKLLLVLCLLGLAAINKFTLVPALAATGNPRRLQRSIAGEIVLAFLILLLTALFTTVTGPASM